MSDWVDVARVEDLPPGSRRAVDVDDVIIIVFNLNGEYYAIEDVCTHDYSSLDEGELDGDQIICPRHGARFNLKTGEALTAPAYEPIPTFPVRVEDGTVQVRDDRWD
jgi:3-phenylpropionate/trans-cinnamate dioxygenase ferredoxin subunit